MGADAVEIGLLKKSMCGTRDAASNWERDWPKHIKSQGYQLGLSSKNLFRHEERRVSGTTHGDDLMLTGPTDQLTEFQNDWSLSNQDKFHQFRVNGEHQSVEQKVAL